MLNHLRILIFLGMSVTALGGSAAAMDWTSYQQVFVASDGRVLDPSQNSISHSEGQGYGLLLALMNEDRPAFERILKWTMDNLQVRRDALLAWSWGRRPNGAWNVIDYNNASDGDILTAFALLKAAQRWGHAAHREAALRLIRDIRIQLAVAVRDYQLIAPAYFGFNGEAGHVFNTGYLVLPAFADFARVDDEIFWKRVLTDSRRLLQRGVFSRFQLPADWVALQDGQVTVDRTRSPFFGYEAIRVPLYLSWQGSGERLAVFANYLQFVENAGYLPLRVNLVEETVSADEAPAGFYAVMGLYAERLGKEPLASNLFREAATRIAREPQDYFSNTLYLLARGKME
jgi:endoglucanase